MIKIKLRVLTLITLLISNTIFVSCSKDDALVNSSQSIENISSKSLFEQLTNNDFKTNQRNQKEIITVFTDLMHNFNVENFEILTSNERRVKFKINAGEIFLNGESYSLNQKTYTLKKSLDSVYQMSFESLSVSYNSNTNITTLISPQNSIALNEFDGTQFNENVSKKFGILISLLREMIITNVEKSESERLPHGTHLGVGVHLDRGSAEYACNRDYNDILAQNSNCISPGGVSISCAWDNHLCVCTATFYCL